MLEKIKRKLEFKFSIFKLKNAHMKLVKHNIKILKFCLYNINKIYIPKTNEENEVLKKLIALYDETVKDLSKDIDKCRNYIWN